MRATLRILFVVLVMIFVFGCFTARKKGGPGTNTTAGNGSDYDGPWSGGTTAAAIEQP